MQIEVLQSFVLESIATRPTGRTASNDPAAVRRVGRKAQEQEKQELERHYAEDLSFDELRQGLGFAEITNASTAKFSAEQR